MGGGAPTQRFAAPAPRMNQGFTQRVAPQGAVMQQRAVAPQAVGQQRAVSPRGAVVTGQGWQTGPVRAVPGVRVAPVSPVVGHAVARPIVPSHAVVVSPSHGVYGYGHAYYGGGYYPYYSVPYYHFHSHFYFSFGLSVGYPVAFPYGAYYAPYADPYPYPVYGYPSSYGVAADPGAYYSTGSSTNSVAGGYPANSDYENSNYGGISFDITPNDAAVFVDTKYVGTVADFSSQEPPLALKLGKHHIDIRAQGYETMSFYTDVIAGQVTPYQGQMKVIR
jgi:hypothetical protein